MERFVVLYISAPVQLGMAAGVHEWRFVHLFRHRRPGTLYQWRLSYGKRYSCALQEEIRWSWRASSSGWVLSLLLLLRNTMYFKLPFHLLFNYILLTGKHPGQCAVLKRSGRFVYYLVMLLGFINIYMLFLLVM